MRFAGAQAFERRPQAQLPLIPRRTAEESYAPRSFVRNLARS